ncbi:hypothetical protein GCM10011408_23800 [Dyella caseinilytica]|nr:hypothetical protein GCM10011408_23800 [Dyella caseinilytica]
MSMLCIEAACGNASFDDDAGAAICCMDGISGMGIVIPASCAVAAIGMNNHAAAIRQRFVITT